MKVLCVVLALATLLATSASATAVSVKMRCTQASFDAAANSYTNLCVNDPTDTSGITVNMTITQTGSQRYAVGAGGSITLP